MYLLNINYTTFIRHTTHPQVMFMRNKKKIWNDLYTHFSQQPHNKLTWRVIFYYFFCFVFFSFCKKIIKYYQPHQFVVGLLWEMSVGIISQKKKKKYYQPRQLVVGLLWEISVRIISQCLLHSSYTNVQLHNSYTIFQFKKKKFLQLLHNSNNYFLRSIIKGKC
jgi:hypothetical protein